MPTNRVSLSPFFLFLKTWSIRVCYKLQVLQQRRIASRHITLDSPPNHIGHSERTPIVSDSAVHHPPANRLLSCQWDNIRLHKSLREIRRVCDHSDLHPQHTEHLLCERNTARYDGACRREERGQVCTCVGGGTGR